MNNELEQDLEHIKEEREEFERKLKLEQEIATEKNKLSDLKNPVKKKLKGIFRSIVNDITETMKK